MPRPGVRPPGWPEDAPPPLGPGMPDGERDALVLAGFVVGVLMAIALGAFALGALVDVMLGGGK